MTGTFIVFFFLALIAITGAVVMLNVNRVSHMIVSLVFTFLSIAGVYVTLSAEFAATVQVLIYSGAVTILMLFGIMLTKHDASETVEAPRKQSIAAFVGVAALGGALFLGIKDLNIEPTASDLHIKNTEQIGVSLFSEYVIPFELTSVLLLVALVGAVILSKKDEDEKGGEDV
ncbi:MAG: NADH-quinone oxidoreductase subunit J [Bacilli bacterium]